MSQLQTDPRIGEPDRFYQALAALYDGLDAEASLRASARLILLLANHIGEHEVLLEAIRRAQTEQEEAHA